MFIIKVTIFLAKVTSHLVDLVATYTSSISLSFSISLFTKFGKSGAVRFYQHSSLSLSVPLLGSVIVCTSSLGIATVCAVTSRYMKCIHDTGVKIRHVRL